MEFSQKQNKREGYYCYPLLRGKYLLLAIQSIYIKHFPIVLKRDSISRLPLSINELKGNRALRKSVVIKTFDLWTIF